MERPIWIQDNVVTKVYQGIPHKYRKFKVMIYSADRIWNKVRYNIKYLYVWLINKMKNLSDIIIISSNIKSFLA